MGKGRNPTRAGLSGLLFHALPSISPENIVLTTSRPLQDLKSERKKAILHTSTRCLSPSPPLATKRPCSISVSFTESNPGGFRAVLGPSRLGRSFRAVRTERIGRFSRLCCFQAGRREQRNKKRTIGRRRFQKNETPVMILHVAHRICRFDVRTPRVCHVFSCSDAICAPDAIMSRRVAMSSGK